MIKQLTIVLIVALGWMTMKSLTAEIISNMPDRPNDDDNLMLLSTFIKRAFEPLGKI